MRIGLRTSLGWAINTDRVLL